MNTEENYNVEINVKHYNTLPNSIHRRSFMNCLYLNAQSLRTSLFDLQDFIDSLNYRIHLVLVTETWLSPDEGRSNNLQGYHAYHSMRPDGSGGGVSIFVHNNFDTANVIFEESINNNNILLISLIKHQLNIALCYRQPNNRLDLNGSIFIKKLDILLNEFKKIIFFGDYNIDIFANTTTLPKTTIDNYINLIESNGLVFLNSRSNQFPTRISNQFNTSSCIDHIFTDLQFHNDDFQYNVYYFDNIADHKNIILNIVKDNHEDQSDIIKCFKIINNKQIASLKLFENIKTDNFETYVNKIHKIITDNTLEIKMNVTGKKPYINQRILNIITIRNKYLRLKSKFPTNTYFSERFKFYRSLCRKETQKSKKDYFNDQLAKNVLNPKKTWQHLNTLLYNKSPNSNHSCTLLVDNGISINKKESIADHFNRHFVNVSNQVINQINFNQSEYDEFINSETYEISTNFACPSVTEDEIKLIIENLKSSNAQDCYKMSNNFVKYHKNSLSKNLSILINTHLFNGIFPDVLKLGLVIPIHKNGNKTFCNNYRPITINPVFGKIFEYVIYRRLQDHLELNNIIHRNQFGYVRKSNCEIAALHILNDIYSSVDEKKPVSLTCIDLSKAFDCIQFHILVEKLRKLNLDPFFLKLLTSYIYGRKQAVVIDGVLSIFLLINGGSPQGGVLSGPFFDLYINSIFNLNLNGNLILYCDDMSLINYGQDRIDLKIKIEQDLALIHKWLNCHLLCPNVTKTKYVLFHGRKRFENFTERAMNIRFNQSIIERSESVKILGLTIDEELSFKEHVDQIKKKITPFIYALRRSRKYITEKTAKDLYYAHVQSHLVYMNTIWSGSAIGLINSLEILQRKALRIVLNKSWFAGDNILYSQRLLPVSVMCQTNCSLMVFKMISNLIKNNVELRVSSDVHDHFTRNRENFVIKRCHFVLTAQNFYIRAFDYFNNLPQNIKDFNSLSLIKSRLKEYYYEMYCVAIQATRANN